MTPNTLLLRQIHPSFVQNGRVTSQAFRPTPKDQFHLSVDNGDRISPEAAWRNFTSSGTCTSDGVQAVSNAECTEQQLSVTEDGQPHPAHCSIDFSAFDQEGIKRKAKLLRAHAARRGWLFRDE